MFHCFHSLSYKHLSINNKQCWSVAWLIGLLVDWLSFAVKGFWVLGDNIYECACCYNRCNGNPAKGIWDLCLHLYFGWLVITYR
jgi:hypothetical protein